MIDPRFEAVLIRRPDRSALEDKTPDVVEYETRGDSTLVTFRTRRGPQQYTYSARRVIILSHPTSRFLEANVCITVSGQAVHGVTGLLSFDGPGGTWWRIFSSDAAGERYTTCGQEDIGFVRLANEADRQHGVLRYWHDVVSHLPQDDPLRKPYEGFRAIPADSVLNDYLAAGSPGVAASVDDIVLPFSSNLSQGEAIRKGLTHRISIIDGPPGTGKTQTILNFVANVISVPGQSVGIVSSTNAAVENVRDKLTKEGYGHVIADLRSSERRRDFFSGQHAVNVQVQRRVGVSPVVMPEAGRVSELDSLLQRLHGIARKVAGQKQELAAYRLEQRHFSRHTKDHDPASLPPLALLNRHSSRILEFLAETAVVPAAERPLRKLVRRLIGRFRYGSTKGIDPRDTDVVLLLQSAFYDKKIAELEKDIQQGVRILAENDFSALEEELMRASRQVLDASLYRRYARARARNFSDETYRRQFNGFVDSYPVILSTCHSLRRSLPAGCLLDYLVIDEASQVDLLAAGLALSCARNVVGDLQQLPQISSIQAARRAKPAPAPAYDYGRHNILSSMIEHFGASIPRTMLREHYRCDPAIIDFCNRKFYGGQLVPYTKSDPDNTALVVVRTTPGNHMRRHGGGGRTNQREADVIAREVLSLFCSDTRHEDIGVISPYRRQADKVADALANNIQADTVHKFQGREKDIIIMSTVLDETRTGNNGIEFVDNPQLVNVAVSRAVKRFILVTNHQMMPSSRHLRDLVQFIQYQDPQDAVFDSGIVSVFDLLYKEYSALLQPMAARLKSTSSFASENIMWTLLLDILAEEAFKELAVAHEVLLRNLLADLSSLTRRQVAYVRNRASMDFVIYNRITNRPVLALEVDGFAFHEDNEDQKDRDSLKDAICRAHDIQLLRLPTTGSREEQLIRQALSAAMSAKARYTENLL